MGIRLVLAIVAIGFSCNVHATDPNAEQSAFFESKIRPALVKHCHSCHSEQAGKLRGGLLLDSKAGWQAGGDSGKPAVVPGKPEESVLLQALKYQDGMEMPPKGQLPKAVIDDFALWIKTGAFDPREGEIEQKRADKTWWSLQPLAKVDLPTPEGIPASWNVNPIDRFLFAKLKEKGLQPSPPADPRTLIRRISYNLTGLPPSYAEVEQFAEEYSQDARAATERLVDRLLESPQYGEQWGRHWLDVIRFGESNGFERNVIIDDLWPFRDYVIRSFNEDKPFNRLIVEHLAGDVVAEGDPDLAIGTAFLVCGPYDNVGNQDKAAALNIRAVTLDDLVSTTGSAFLGLTLNCARCHHHKFDPIPTEDYYRVRAAFEGVYHGSRVLVGEAAKKEHRDKLEPLTKRQAELTQLKKGIEDQIESRAKAELKEQTYQRPKPDPELTEERFEPVKARHLKFVMYAHSGNPRSAVGARLDEFEVWTAGEQSRNVALAANGGTARGAQHRTAEDFAGAYGPELTIDGEFGARWFIGTPAELTITFAKAETVDRVRFSNAREGRIVNRAVQGEFPVEYEILISNDGKEWTAVADSSGREPWTEAHAIERLRRDTITAEERKKISDLNRQLSQLQKQIAEIPPLPSAWAGNFQPVTEPTHVHKGGDPLQPGDKVVPSSLAVLDRVTEPYQLEENAPESQRRLKLAEWIASNDNPLTARVLANRLWHYHFGTGIVDSPSDFGYLGGQPTHPELLDWLAARLHHHNWRLKPLHREIVLSQAYQQSSMPRDEAMAIDQASRFLWRFPPRRLSGEEVRDSFLQLAGKLNLKPGGPGFRLYRYTQDNVSTYTPLDQHGPETYRRAVYHQNARASVVDLLSDFDFPDTALPAPRRSNTTTPLQALTMMNHNFTLDMASSIADRIDASSPRSTQVAEIYHTMLQRQPTPEEREAAAALVEQHGLATLCRAMLNLNELVYLE